MSLAYRKTIIPVVFLTTFLLAGCGDEGPGRLAPLGEKEPCPTPGPGLTLGGVGGGGNTNSDEVRRLVLMGGGAEDDAAATLFVEGAQGGDVVILRATGSTTSYPDYFRLTLSPSVAPASVITIRTDDPSAGGDLGVLCRVNRAEALWLAGGDQWDYLGRWPQDLFTAIQRLTNRRSLVGGTSAGAMVLGQGAFDAEAGTVSSDEALADPLRTEVSVSLSPISQPELLATLVDTHFSERGREGRLLVFLARLLDEIGGAGVVGIGLDEATALVIEAGNYRVFGPEGSAVWVYRVSEPATLVPGVPLDLDGIQRVRLHPGTEGRWPLDFDAVLFDALRVQAGVIGPGGGG